MDFCNDFPLNAPNLVLTPSTYVQNPRNSDGTIRKFEDNFEILEKIGYGSFAIVKRCLRKIDSTECAVKIIKKSALNEQELILLKQEIRILKRLDHLNIMKYIDSFEDNTHIKLVLEICEGGDLFSLICKSTNAKTKAYTFSEKRAAFIIYQLANSIHYIHKMGIVHRDLKPENVLFMTKTYDKIKLTDFGLAADYGNSGIMTTKCGSPNYVAPEVLREDYYGSQCDWWSLGTILYVMLSGFYPFYAKNIPKMYEKILKAEYSFHSKRWKQVSPDARDLITKLLELNPRKRYGYRKIIRHPFITKNLVIQRISPNTINLANNYKFQRNSNNETPLKCASNNNTSNANKQNTNANNIGSSKNDSPQSCLFACLTPIKKRENEICENSPISNDSIEILNENENGNESSEGSEERSQSRKSNSNSRSNSNSNEYGFNSHNQTRLKQIYENDELDCDPFAMQPLMI